MADYRPAVHFVGFRDDRYYNAVAVFGPPDFIHRVWDVRAVADVAPHDLVVFANDEPACPSPFCYDDSNQLDDPAAAERK